MTKGLDWLSAITLFGGIQGLSLALMVSHRGNRKANQYLALFLFAFSVQIFDYLYVYTGS